MGYNMEVLKEQDKEFKKDIDHYKPIINEFLDELENKNLINKYYPQRVRTNLKNFGFVANAATILANDFHNIYPNNSNTVNKIELMSNKFGINDNIPYIVSICTDYQVNSELLKKHLLIVVKWNKFKKINSNSTLGTLLSRLRDKGFGDNKFVSNLSKSNNIRNSIAHCTYFYENNQLSFYKNIYDDNPIKMNLKSFKEESVKLNIMTSVLQLIYLDRYFSEKVEYD